MSWSTKDPKTLNRAEGAPSHNPKKAVEQAPHEKAPVTIEAAPGQIYLVIEIPVKIKNEADSININECLIPLHDAPPGFHQFHPTTVLPLLVISAAQLFRPLRKDLDGWGLRPYLDIRR